MSEWNDILGHVSSNQKMVRLEAQSVWYRGQSDSKWILESGLHRYVKRAFKTAKRPFDESDAIDLLRGNFKSLFYRYKSRAPHLLSNREQSSWSIIFSMQHYGVPTTLLDWTDSFACALYFTNLNRNPSDDAAIFILKPNALNENVTGRSGLIHLEDSDVEKVIDTDLYLPITLPIPGKLPTIAVSPIQTNPRMIAQKANFTICGSSFEAIEEEYSEFVEKIELPASTYEDSQVYLDTIGATHFSYFPDLEGLCTELKNGIEWELKQIEEETK